MVNNEEVIGRTRKWITDVVIGCDFCPFAAREVNAGRVRYTVDCCTDLATCLEALMRECRHLDENEDTATTLLILPAAFGDFEDFLELIDLADQLLADQGYEGTYQIAGFHPEYRFAEAPDDDPANYTNRSVYPMLHLLREEHVERAVDAHPDVEGIPERNIEFARKKGLEEMKRLRNACL
jgi:hypothetical protein